MEIVNVLKRRQSAQRAENSSGLPMGLHHSETISNPESGFRWTQQKKRSSSGLNIKHINEIKLKIQHTRITKAPGS